MAFKDSFSKLAKTVSDGAKTAAKKSSDLYEITKLNMQISSEEEKIKEAFAKIGEHIFESLSNQEIDDPELLAIFNEIKDRKENISQIKIKVSELKNSKICPSCGSEIELNIVFCPKCGTKQENKVEEAPMEEQTISCSGCGTQLTENDAFCPNCGKKVE